MMHYTPRSTIVHQSLLETKTFGGVEDKLALGNIMFGITIIFGYKMIAYLPVMLVFHAILKYLTRKDPYTRRNYIRYNKQSDRYDPWGHATQHTNRRPYAQGALL